MELSPDQQHAIDAMIEFAGDDDNRLGMSLQGSAGTGKTTAMRAFLKRFQGEVILSASTHKAAKVLAEVCGEPAHTVHSVLGLQPTKNTQKGRHVLEQKRAPSDSLKGSLLVVDECSMIDTTLLKFIHDICKKLDAKVLFIGDPYQLPPVYEKESAVFQVVGSVKLTTVHRQALDNPVLAFANEFRLSLDGEPVPAIEPRGSTVELLGEQDYRRRVISEFTNGDNVGEVRALAWTNSRVRELNDMVRRSVLGDAADAAYVPGELFVANSPIFANEQLVVPNEGEVRIIRVREIEAKKVGDFTYEIAHLRVEFDGKQLDITAPVDWDQAGTAIKLLQSKASRIQARFYKGELHLDSQRRAAWVDFFKLKESLADLRPPYASTVHKAQGSTYKRVHIDVGDIGRCTHDHVIKRMMYVACTRPSESLTMTGELPSRLYIDREAG